MSHWKLHIGQSLAGGRPLSLYLEMAFGHLFWFGFETLKEHEVINRFPLSPPKYSPYNISATLRGNDKYFQWEATAEHTSPRPL